MIIWKEDKFMGEKVWIQCTQCGQLHKAKAAYSSDDDIYIEIHCPFCRDSTNHLIIGPRKEDVYLVGDTFLDKRYFKYNTK